MANLESAPPGPTQTISVGGHGANITQVAGSRNTVSAKGNVSVGTPEDVQQALLVIQAALSAQPATKALTEAAMQQAKADAPDKAAIGSQLKAALDIAKTTLDWAELAKELAPAVKIAAGWLGGEWMSLLQL